jgi:hypothetical protein
MAEWLVAQIAPTRHEYVAHHVSRIGLKSFYPRWRRTHGRPPQVEEGDLYPGYMFVCSPIYWYRILSCCSAVYGIAAQPSTLEPLRSEALDAHVLALIARTDRDGFLNPPITPKRVRFMRGDKVRIENWMITGEATFVRFKNGGGAEVVPVGGSIPFTVRETAVYAV